MADLRGRVVLVTGGSSGIGRETARGLAREGATVLLHGRNESRLAEAAASIRAEASGEVHTLVADLARLDEVRRLASEVRERFEALHVLVNNAGLVLGERRLTPDGHETMFAVNHLAPFLLTELLRPLLSASAPARVVTVASDAHRRARLDLDDLQSERRFSAYGTYGMTKLANILHTRELARRLTGQGVTANCCHPGVVATRFGRGKDVGGLYGLAVTILAPAFKRPEQGAETPLYLATGEEPGHVTGGYFKDRRLVEPSAAARDPETARRLWAASERLVGLR